MQLVWRHQMKRYARQFSVAIALTLAVYPAAAPASDLRTNAIVRVVNQATPSVVNIHGRKSIKNDTAGQTAGEEASKQLVNGMGTGVVIDPRGYIITNYHVVEGVAKIQVTTHEKKTFVAKLINHDPKTDLAIIKVPDEANLPVIRIGTSSDLQPGEDAIAVGNPFGYGSTVTRGIISALHRTVPVGDDQQYEDVIQTDASINPGNSGGPLLNIDGDMIGINVAVRVGAQGIAFAIPIDEALEVAAKLMSIEKIDGTSHGISGKRVGVTAASKFEVTSITTGGAGETAGLKPGDVIEAVDDQSVLRRLDFERALLGRKAGETAKLLVRRGDESLQVALELKKSSELAAVKAPPAFANAAERKVWDTLGVKLVPAASSDVRRITPDYAGGLKVVEVKANSPAAKSQIASGDILVGLHKWTTVSQQDINYILTSEEFVGAESATFYILRDSQVLYGEISAAPIGRKLR
jgi:serine protease Do